MFSVVLYCCAIVILMKHMKEFYEIYFFNKLFFCAMHLSSKEICEILSFFINDSLLACICHPGCNFNRDLWNLFLKLSYACYAVVILAETRKIADILLQQGIKVQTPLEISPIQVHPARVLSQIYSFLGMSLLSHWLFLTLFQKNKCSTTI